MIKYDYCHEQFGEAMTALKLRGRRFPLRDRVLRALVPIGVLTDGRSSIPDNVRERFNALMQLRTKEISDSDLTAVAEEIKELAALVEAAYKESVREFRATSRKRR